MRYRMFMFVFIFFRLLEKRMYADSPAGFVNLQTFQPTLGSQNLFTLEGTRPPGHLIPAAAIWFDAAFNPLRRYDPLNNRNSGDTVSHFVTWHVMGGLGIKSGIFLGFDIPLIIYQDFDRKTPSDLVPFAPNYNTAGIGDVRIWGKFRILGDGEKGLGLALVPQFLFPTGDSAVFRGSGAVGIEPKVTLDYRFWKGAFVALNVSLLFRTSSQTAGDTTISHQIRYGLGVYIPLPVGFSAVGELTGGTSLINGPKIYSPLEMLFGAKWEQQKGISVFLGGGVGLTPAAGLPQGRVFVGISYVWIRSEQKDSPRPKAAPLKSPPPVASLQAKPTSETKPALPPGVSPSLPPRPPAMEPDLDADGVVGNDDQCPTAAGPKANQGCPIQGRFVQIEKDRISLKQTVQFVTNRATIQKSSYALLDEIVRVLKQYPSIHLRIEGYTDLRGSQSRNFRLSTERAGSVRDYLVGKGIDPLRLTSVGHGNANPLGDNKTQVGQDKNRRVEFIITQ